MTVIEVHQETEHLLSIRLQPSVDGTRFEFRPGQHVKVMRRGGTESVLAIASEPEESGFIEFLVKDIEDAPPHDFCHVQVDESVQVSMPIGAGYPLEKLKGRNVILVGMGTALSPLRSILKSILRHDQHYGKVTLVYGAKRPEDMPFIDDFNIWGKKIRVETAVSNPGKAHWQGFKGRVTELIPKLSLSCENTVACVCGSREMQEEVKKVLMEQGVNVKDILIND